MSHGHEAVQMRFASFAFIPWVLEGRMIGRPPWPLAWAPEVALQRLDQKG